MPIGFAADGRPAARRGLLTMRKQGMGHLLKKPIIESLERVAEIAGDPAPAVYERLFEQHPEMKPLFILDTNCSARGHMLSEVLECVLDFCDGNTYALNFIESEKMNHDGIGVPPDVFHKFFAITVEVFRELLDADWTAEFEAAWNGVLAELNVPASSTG